MSIQVDMIAAMSSAQLIQLREAISQEETKRYQQEEAKKLKTAITNLYGDYFCEIVGLENISRLPEVKAEDVGLHVTGKYPYRQAQPKMLGKESAVRGIMSGDRPFVAIKLQVEDEESKVLGIFVEIIFKSDTGSYHSGSSAIDDYGNTHSELIPSSDGLSDENMKVVKNLLEGKKVCLKANTTTRYLQKV